LLPAGRLVIESVGEHTQGPKPLALHECWEGIGLKYPDQKVRSRRREGIQLFLNNKALQVTLVRSEFRSRGLGPGAAYNIACDTHG
jgi:hypothetical protein